MSTLGIPWEEIAINTIAPRKIDMTNYDTLSFNGFTISDTTTGLLKNRLATQRNHGGLEAVDALDNVWLTRYPKPVYCIFDQGTMFLNIIFSCHLILIFIKPVPTSIAKPKANTIVECSHDTIKAAMRTELHENPPITI